MVAMEILLLVPVSLFILFFLRSRTKHRYPPGPPALPLIGNMLMMDKLTHRGLAQLAQTYGGLFHLRLGVLHMVVVSTPEMAREFLLVQDTVFSNRPANAAITYLTYDRADMAFANYGPFWRQMRKLCVMKLFSRRRAESWASVREEVDDIVNTVSANTGTEINVGELVFALTRNIIYKAAFGSSSHEGQDEFVKILQEFSKLFGAFNMADFIPCLGWIHARGFNERMAKARGALDVFIDKIIDAHNKKKKTNESEGDSDMVDELMAFMSDSNSENDSHDHDSTSALKLSRDNIKAIIMDVMFGGTETVASVIEWTMAELMKSPDDLKCAVKETLRLHPPIPLLLHETAADSIVSSYSIPAGARVWVNAWAIGRDKNSWEEPDAFKPSRFLSDGVPDFKGSDFEFIPFGSGRRSCPGMNLGLYAVEMAVAHLLHCFRWELPGEMQPQDLDMSDLFGLTAPRAVRLIAVPTYRLTCH